MEAVNALNNTLTTPIVEDELFRKSHIQSYKTSGLTRAEYCRLNKLNYHRFCYWLSRAEASSPLIPIKVKQPSKIASQEVLCTLILKDGLHLKIYDLQVLSILMEKVV